MAVAGLTRLLALAALAASPVFASGPGSGARTPNEACVEHVSKSQNQSMRFAILPDRTGSERPGKFAQAIVTLRALRPDFVISVGDLIEGYTKDSQEIGRQWDEVDAFLSQVGTVVCAAPGNHDVWDRASGAIWEQRRGSRHYSFMSGGLLFLVLDTEDPPPAISDELKARKAAMTEAWSRDPEGTQQRILDAVRDQPPPKLPGQSALSTKQTDWAVNELKKHADARWTFVILHRPAWREEPNPLARIEQALEGRNYTMIAGHEHYFEIDRRKGADHIVTATAGGVWLRDGPGRLDHVLLVEMDKEEGARPVIHSFPLSSVIAD